MRALTATALVVLTPLLIACPPEGPPNPPPTPTTQPTPTTTTTSSVPVPPPAPKDGYQEIGPGFDFPAAKGSLEALRDAGNEHALRLHVWKVWAGMNQLAPHGGPLWETWYSKSEVFGGATPQGDRVLRRTFERPKQLDAHGAAPQAAGQSLLSFVLMNGDTRAHVRQNHFNQQTALDQANAALGSAPNDKRDILAFPAKAMSLKAVWRAVKKFDPTPIPIWDGDPKPGDPTAIPPSSWTRVVVVDPTRSVIPAGETKTVPGYQGLQKVVALDDFYHVTFTAEDVGSAQKALDPSLQPGDYAVLVCMHMTTKEIADWVWATFWWHDSPNAGPFAADRPAANVAPMPAVFRHYLMSESFSMTKPLEADGKPHIAFNPWLEATFDGGKQSNCMNCHRQAAWPAPQSGFTVERGLIPDTDPRFTGKIRLDFLWSIADAAR